ncbi:hypothetical protein ACFX19_041094 [Malus domestica]
MGVRFWEDNWVPGISGAHLTPLNHSAINKEGKVADFIDQILRAWNLDFLSNLILEMERDTISRIYVGAAFEF